MTADEARLISKQGYKTESEKELSEIFKAIEFRAKSGYKSLDRELPPRFLETCLELKNKGFQIDTFQGASFLFAYIPGFTRISWE